MGGTETTDLTLFVRSSQEDITGWNRQRIVDALIRETNVERETAEDISREVERQIATSGIEVLTASLIRELVDAKLIERGLDGESRMHARLGFPLYDVEQLIFYSNKENANIPHSPEGTNLTLAEGIKKEYALLNVFSDDVSYAHARGDIHIHNLGYIDRPYCSCQSLERIKKFGLNLPHSITVATPAMRAETLLAHMVRFAAALQGNFSGAIGWDGVNIHFAPYLAGLSDDRVRQIAQMLLYEFAQQAVGRGGQTIFTDIHLFWEVPDRFASLPAIGPGGQYTGKTYGDYEQESQRFAEAIFDVFREGDAAGQPFVFPRPFVHITEAFFRTAGSEEFLRKICAVAAEKGNTHFILDRGGCLSLSECGTFRVSDEQDGEGGSAPWNMRHAALQNVSINLPRLGYRAEGSDDRLFDLLMETADMALWAHMEKKAFIDRLLAQGEAGPLSLLTGSYSDEPYFQNGSAVCLLGMVGLDELVAIHCGGHLHDSEEARRLGFRIIKALQEIAGGASRRKGLRVILNQSPAETTAYRFARLDLKHYSPRSGHFIRGNIARGELYYTNSTCCSVSAPLAPFDRVALEGMFHPFIEGNTATYLWLDEKGADAGSIAELVARAFRETTNRQIVVSPEFTTCSTCGRTARGLADRCPGCGAETVEGIARISGYYSKVSGWNKGKIAELRDRYRRGFHS
ncbi:MAG: anaerobic ribonucleoside-triphosphate reductase [Deltaproteobacteria bacterium]|nr:anaerobic ribonucleoside-triphosphate reductase [Deltaproteobacteria bacterium]